jgi:hypothetical protein
MLEKVSGSTNFCRIMESFRFNISNILRNKLQNKIEFFICPKNTQTYNSKTFSA